MSAPSVAKPFVGLAMMGLASATCRLNPLNFLCGSPCPQMLNRAASYGKPIPASSIAGKADRRRQQLRPPGALSPAGDDQLLVAAVGFHDPDPPRRGPRNVGTVRRPGRLVVGA